MQDHLQASVVRRSRLKCEQELKQCNEVIAELCETLKPSIAETDYQSVLKEVESLKEQLKATKTQEKKVADLMKALFLSVIIKPEEKREVDIIPELQEPQDTEDISSSIIVQETEKISEPVEEKETETASADTQELIPLDLAQQTGPDMVPELMSHIQMELVQQPKVVSEPPKGIVSSKKRKNKIQERVVIVIEMEPASKHPEDFQTSAPLQATEDTAAPEQAECNPQKKDQRCLQRGGNSKNI